MTKRNLILLGSIGALFGLGILIIFGKDAIDLLKLTIDTLVATFSQVEPWLFSIAFAIICSFPIPSSPFYVAASVAYDLDVALIAVAVGLLGNLMLSYFWATKVLRNIIEKILAAKDMKLPDVTGLKPWEAVVITRLLPVLPLIFQSYLLGLARIPFRTYILFSWPTAFLPATGIVLVSEGLLKKEASMIFAGISWFVIVSFAVKYSVKRLRSKQA